MLGRVTADQAIRNAKSGQTKPALVLREARACKGKNCTRNVWPWAGDGRSWSRADAGA